MLACLPRLGPESFLAHPLHGPDRCWSETNCALDLWIELLHALGLPPEAALSVTATQGFEGDQFTFIKLSHDDLRSLFGLTVRELAIYEAVETHVARQMQRGAICLVDVDPFYLPDTGVAAYRRQHGKTTIAPNRIDIDGRWLEYFHNAGYFALDGDDFDGALRPPMADGAPFRPYVEFVALRPAPLPPDALLARAAALYAERWAQRPTENPIRAFQGVAPAQVEALADAGEQAFHDFAFHSLRLLGSNFELLGAGLGWLHGPGDPRIALCTTIAETVKGAEFQLARAVARHRFEGFAQVLEPAAQAWDELFSSALVPHAA